MARLRFYGKSIFVLLCLYGGIGCGLWRLLPDAPSSNPPFNPRLVLVGIALLGLTLDWVRFNQSPDAAFDKLALGIELGLALACLPVGMAIAGTVFFETPSDALVWSLIAGGLVMIYAALAGAFAYTLLFLNAMVLLDGLIGLGTATGSLLGAGRGELAVWTHVLAGNFDMADSLSHWALAALATTLGVLILWNQPDSK